MIIPKYLLLALLLVSGLNAIDQPINEIILKVTDSYFITWESVFGDLYDDRGRPYGITFIASSKSEQHILSWALAFKNETEIRIPPANHGR